MSPVFLEFGRRHIHPAFYFGDMFIVRPFQVQLLTLQEAISSLS